MSSINRLNAGRSVLPPEKPPSPYRSALTSQPSCCWLAITGAAKFDFGASRPGATRQQKESRMGQTCDNPHARNPWSPSPQRVVRESLPKRPPPPIRTATWLATESLTRDSGKAWNCQKTTKKAGVLRDAKRRLLEFTLAVSFLTEQRSCGSQI